MGELRRIGLVRSVPGKKGGYCLSLSPQQISIGNILELFETRLEQVDDDPAWEDELKGLGSDHQTVKLRLVLGEISWQVNQLLSRTTLEDILANRPIRYHISNTEKFLQGGGI